MYVISSQTLHYDVDILVTWYARCEFMFVDQAFQPIILTRALWVAKANQTQKSMYLKDEPTDTCVMERAHQSHHQVITALS